MAKAQEFNLSNKYFAHSKYVVFVIFMAFSVYNLKLFISDYNLIFLCKLFLNLAIAVAFWLQKKPSNSDSSKGTLVVCLIHVIAPMALYDSENIFLYGKFIQLLFLIGLLLSGISLIELWKSIGILPANRGIINTGAYKYVRHPVYLGYLLSMISWCLIFPAIGNILLTIIFALLTVIRINKEESLLFTSNTDYFNYTIKTKHKLIPFLY